MLGASRSSHQEQKPRKDTGLENLIIGNAAGTAKTLADVELLGTTAVTRITLGSITWEERAGNIGATTGYNERTGMFANALGLPNMGFQKYRPLLPHFVRSAHRARKQLVASVAGFTPKEYVDMAQGCYAAGIDLVELNLGCPNVWGPGGRKLMPSEDPELTRDILIGLTPYLVRNRKKVSVKLSPLSDLQLLSELTDVLLESGVVCEVVGCNTIPDQEPSLEDGSYALSFRAHAGAELRHTGGVSGRPLLLQSLCVCSSLRMWLPKTIRVIGAGGILSGTDAKLFLDVGAEGFECAAAYMVFGPKIFGQIAAELLDV